MNLTTFCPYCLSPDVRIVPSDESFKCEQCKLKWSYGIEEMRRDVHETFEEMSHEVPS